MHSLYVLQCQLYRADRISCILSKEIFVLLDAQLKLLRTNRATLFNTIFLKRTLIRRAIKRRSKLPKTKQLPRMKISFRGGTVPVAKQHPDLSEKGLEFTSRIKDLGGLK